MPRPKRLTVLTTAPAHSAAALDEWQAGIDTFLEWANRARLGETSEPAALQADAALTAFSLGRYHVPFIGLSVAAVAAGRNILDHVRDGHWHLKQCPFCTRWLLAKDQRRALCRRIDCVRAAKRVKRAAQRAAQAALDDGAKRRTF